MPPASLPTRRILVTVMRNAEAQALSSASVAICTSGARPAAKRGGTPLCSARRTGPYPPLARG
eukprot:6677181-Lingulodinium_polyedra.AAC.1